MSASTCALPQIRRRAAQLHRRSRHRLPPLRVPPGSTRQGSGQTPCAQQSGAALSADPPGIWRGAAVPRSQTQSQLCPVAFQQPPTCLNPCGTIVATRKAQSGQRSAGHPGEGKPLEGCWLCPEGLLRVLGKICLCNGMAKAVVGWDGVTSRDLALRCRSTCRADRGVCQGRDLPREWSQQALAFIRRWSGP